VWHMQRNGLRKQNGSGKRHRKRRGPDPFKKNYIWWFTAEI
jgi:hypothetical protein